MKKLVTLLVFVTTFSNAQNVFFGDTTFKSKLISLGFDTDSDGEIQNAEAEAVTFLDVRSSNITSLIGIDAFTNLITLDCSFNPLGTIEPLTLPWQLSELRCTNCNLTSLDLFSSTRINILLCNNNNLTTLDFYDEYLIQLDCSNNLLTAINPSFGFAVGLYNLNCSGNQITSLNLALLNQLTYLKCDHNNISTLDLTGLSSISILECNNNLLTSLDLSGLSHLAGLDCSNNQLIELIIKNGRNEQLTINGNPNLQFICADESEIGYAQGQAGLGVVVNSYCSFIPGGDYNTITGNIKYDFNNDGCDAGDTIFRNVRVNINDGTTTGASFINTSGNYTFFTQIGSFAITPSIENPTWFNFSPVTATIPFTNNNNNIANQDFCIAPNGVHQDIEVVLSPVTRARPGFDAVYKIVCRNKGTVALSDWTGLTLNYDNSKMSFVSSSQTPSNISLGLLDFGYSLNPFESATIEVTFHINSPLDLNPVNVGTLLIFNATINPIATDELPMDNLFIYNQTVVGSYDPNDITCLEGDVVPSTEIGNYLHYTINFENTGTFPAENVVVKTEIDAAKFDIGSLQLMNANYPVDARITGDKVEFIFKNIQLPIGGHGHILLKIKTQNTLVTGDVVANRGDIYFDYNAPIDTGLANTVFQTLSNTVFEVDNSVAVYPNPTTTQVNIKSDSTIQSIQVYDVQGRILQTKLSNEKQTTIDLTQKEKGIYFFKISTDKGSKIEKVVKE